MPVTQLKVTLVGVEVKPELLLLLEHEAPLLRLVGIAATCLRCRRWVGRWLSSMKSPRLKLAPSPRAARQTSRGLRPQHSRWSEPGTVASSRWRRSSARQRWCSASGGGLPTAECGRQREAVLCVMVGSVEARQWRSHTMAV
jgi:hypothetical protein